MSWPCPASLVPEPHTLSSRGWPDGRQLRAPALSTSLFFLVHEALDGSCESARRWNPGGGRRGETQRRVSGRGGWKRTQLLPQLCVLRPNTVKDTKERLPPVPPPTCALRPLHAGSWVLARVPRPWPPWPCSSQTRRLCSVRRTGLRLAGGEDGWGVSRGKRGKVHTHAWPCTAPAALPGARPGEAGGTVLTKTVAAKASIRDTMALSPAHRPIHLGEHWRTHWPEGDGLARG